MILKIFLSIYFYQFFHLYFLENLDPTKKWTIDPKESFSTQTYTPFEGINVTGKVQTTFLRGNRVFDDGEIIGKPHGEYLARPLV